AGPDPAAQRLVRVAVERREQRLQRGKLVPDILREALHHPLVERACRVVLVKRPLEGTHHLVDELLRRADCRRILPEFAQVGGEEVVDIACDQGVVKVEQDGFDHSSPSFVKKMDSPGRSAVHCAQPMYGSSISMSCLAQVARTSTCRPKPRKPGLISASSSR